jgi:hypothetical protein
LLWRHRFADLTQRKRATSLPTVAQKFNDWGNRLGGTVEDLLKCVPLARRQWKLQTG